MLTGSMGWPSLASLDPHQGHVTSPATASAPRYRPVKARNPFEHILSVSMMLRFSFNQNAAADAIEQRSVRCWSESCVPADIVVAYSGGTVRWAIAVAARSNLLTVTALRCPGLGPGGGHPGFYCLEFTPRRVVVMKASRSCWLARDGGSC